MNSIISVNNVVKSYKKMTALHGVSFDIQESEIFGLLGPDGSGKSTLMHIMSGILRAEGGSVHVLGIDVLKDPEKIKMDIGLMAQGLGLTLSGDLSVKENINYYSDIHGVPYQEREDMKERLLAMTHLTPFARRLVKNLSGGMRQKLALCCTLVHSPRILFLDEPTTGVDPISRRDFWIIINDIVSHKKITAVVSTAYMDEAERFHRVAMMYKGKILGIGPPKEFKSRLIGRVYELYTSNLTKAYDILQSIEDLENVVSLGHKIVVESVSGERLQWKIKGLLAKEGIDVYSFEASEPTMASVFVSSVKSFEQKEKRVRVKDLFERYSSKLVQEYKHGKEAVVEIHELVKDFGKFRAVDHVSFDMLRGEIFGFLGPNGSGKTTTIKMLCGLLKPTSGSGTIAGFDLLRDREEITKRIGYMSQKFSLYKNLTVSENIELFGGIYGVSRPILKERMKLVLELADLEGREREMAGDLPMGVKQRLALGCAFIHQPEIIFLDEPTSGVDPIARARFWEIINELSRRTRMTIIVTTHYMDEAEQCDRLLLINDGRVCALDTPEKLREEVEEEIGHALEIECDDPLAIYEKAHEILPDVSFYGKNILLYTKDPQGDTSRLRVLCKSKGYMFRNIRKRPILFEDVFVHFIKKSASAKI